MGLARQIALILDASVTFLLGFGRQIIALCLPVGASVRILADSVVGFRGGFLGSHVPALFASDFVT